MLALYYLLLRRTKYIMDSIVLLYCTTVLLETVVGMEMLTSTSIKYDIDDSIHNIQVNRPMLYFHHSQLSNNTSNSNTSELSQGSTQTEVNQIDDMQENISNGSLQAISNNTEIILSKPTKKPKQRNRQRNRLRNQLDREKKRKNKNKNATELDDNIANINVQLNLLEMSLTTVINSEQSVNINLMDNGNRPTEPDETSTQNSNRLNDVNTAVSESPLLFSISVIVETTVVTEQSTGGEGSNPAIRSGIWTGTETESSASVPSSTTFLYILPTSSRIPSAGPTAASHTVVVALGVITLMVIGGLVVWWWRLRRQQLEQLRMQLLPVYNYDPADDQDDWENRLLAESVGLKPKEKIVATDVGAATGEAV